MIVLVGFMGAGKTTVGFMLAQELGLPFFDADTLIEQREGMRVADIFEVHGEARFREVERAVIAEVLDGPDAVVALGGGALGDPGTCAALEWATVVYLEASFAEILRRLRGDGTRPLFQGDVRALYEERVGRYESVADVTVPVDERQPEVVAKEIARLLDRDRPVATSAERAAKEVHVSLGDRSYDVHVGRGVIERAASLLPDMPDAQKAFIVTHERLSEMGANVAQAFDERGLEVSILEVDEGEGSKTLATAGELLEALAAGGAHRHDVVAAVGGGVLGDLAGFVASTFARGMPLVHVPTTLLAQVDAAIGGKTAVNLPHGKNLVGTFHQPLCVLCDVNVLETLPEEELRSGFAEVAKYGFIADPPLLRVLLARNQDLAARDPELLAEVVERCVGIKARVVADDERDRGRRAHLNYGHTFAHAIEQARGFGGIRHGEAVALGMVAAAETAAEIGWLDDADVALHREVLRRLGLPVSARLDVAELEPVWVRDKKYRGEVRFVLLRQIGAPEAGVAVGREQVERALERMSP